MSGTRGGRGRIIAMGIGLFLALLLFGASEAKAGKYAVAECGWHLGSDGAWADTTGGAKFRPDAYCATPAGADPFDGAHLKSFTRDGQQTVSGTRFARWRWTAPPGTGIVQVRGTWWHALHDGFEQRLGTDAGNGGFTPFGAAGATDVALREFVAGFSPPQRAFEDRLLCARGESKWCSLDPGSWSALRALTITVEDDSPPAAGLAGELLAGGWQRGGRGIGFWAGELGGGARFAETMVDGARVDLTEYPCAKALIGGEWRATQMQPCPLGPSGSASVDTTRFSDGPHSVHHCVTDFAGNVGCTAATPISIDNNPPAHPRSAHVVGGDQWRRVDDFDIAWDNPDQGQASPIWGAYWRITSGAGFDSGVHFSGGREITAVADRSVPVTGLYSLHLWLRDEAGNDSAATAVEIPLRLDQVPPGVSFPAEGEGEFPSSIAADIYDEHSGPKAGELRYRRLGEESWTDLSARFVAGESADRARLVARIPESLPPGTYLFQAEAGDGAGNSASTTRRADGTVMALRKPLPASPSERTAQGGGPRAPEGRGTKTRIFAHLQSRGRRGTSVTVPFRSPAILRGRLVDAEGSGLAGRRVRVAARPSRGAIARNRVFSLRTGEHGGFRLPLPPGPSRRINLVFRGANGLERASRGPLSLRVRGGILFHVRPTSLDNGQAIRLWGRVRTHGAAIPRRGKIVAVQYLEAKTRRWRPILVTRSDHAGHFRARYRFRYVTTAASIRLRAVALSEERWPYAPGASRSLVVRVRG